MALKVACWGVFVAGTLLAVLRAEIPYIPTEKRAVRGRFLGLAWPHLTLALVYLGTLGWTIYSRLSRVHEASLRLTSEAVWGMVAFATVPALLVAPALYAAWLARRPPAGGAWDSLAQP